MILLAFSLFALIIIMDLLMGLKLHAIILKTINPFRVMETAEYIIVILFSLFLIIGSVKAYLKKKKSVNN
jgi:hypothetical protein